jgi:hypothetical protein
MGWVTSGELVKTVCDRCGLVGMAFEPGDALQAKTKALLWAKVRKWAISPKFDIAFCPECRDPPETPTGTTELPLDFIPTRWDKILKSRD